MDINQVYLSGIVDKISNHLLKDNAFEPFSFSLKTKFDSGLHQSLIQRHQIYVEKSKSFKDKDLKTILHEGVKVNIKGWIKNFVYTDSLGKRVTISHVVASSITPCL